MTRKKDPRTTRLPVPAGQLPSFTPVPRKCARHDGWTPERQRAFIEALADTGSVEAACKAVDMAQRGVYALRREPGAGGFRAAWEAALQLGVARVEDVVMDRALNGVEEPVYSYGKLVGTRRKYNDRLLMFILRNRAPDRFAAGGGPRGLNAVSQMQLDRLHKQWKKEYEAGQRHVSIAEIKASIDRKIAGIRRRIERERPQRRAALSAETLAAFAHFAHLRDRDLAASAADERTRRLTEVTLDTPSTHFDPPETPALPAPKRVAEEEAMPKPGPDYRKWQPPEPEPPKTVWTLKDEGFDP
ncbi:hypothetical protein [Erythrobacter dokdonensis]|uniref:Uncharacterized protein n=1 Tax=Erythrobacter dokdonensis DSW-74 TaxID=1300349 RepID=A0A1A7BIW0_9SPHN|nr:hypothetical protein [Erythrobacter dokdonensis]OBV12409.1 hypothetical protein I603_0540 [Erythrobacter dokdonensis DSW-74]